MQDTSSILSVIDKKTGDSLDLSKIKIDLHSSKYSNTKIAIQKMFINNIPISRNNNYTVSYRCPHCHIINVISQQIFMRKINNGNTKCQHCPNDVVTSIIRTKNKNITKYDSEKYEKVSNEQFESMSDEFINNYFLKNLTIDEFERIRSKIISFQNDKFKDMTNFVYKEHILCNNQTLFVPKLYNIENQTFESVTYIKFKCENCDSEFTNRDLYIQKNKYKIFCKDCSFCNRKFKIKTSSNISNEKITYNSNFEKKFIDFCNSKNILLKNGPKIEYLHNNKQRIYICDWYLPDLKVIIEMKDNHHWHREQVKSGKFENKCKYAKEYAVNNSLEYVIIFPEDYQAFCDRIIHFYEDIV